MNSQKQKHVISEAANNSVLHQIARHIGEWIKGDDNIHCFEIKINNNVYSMTINEENDALLWLGKHDISDVNNHENITTLFTGEAHLEDELNDEDIFWIHVNEQYIVRVNFEDKLYITLYKNETPFYSMNFEYKE